MPNGFTSVNVNNKLIQATQKYIEDTGFYGNPTEFVNAAARQKIEEINKAQIDKLKVDAFFERNR